MARVMLALAATALASSGCAALGLWSMSEAECRAADWQALGVQDGTNGWAASRVSRYREACGEFGLEPDVAAYERGREEGVRRYCRPANGLALGEAGTAYTGVCPSDLEAAFERRYRAGSRIKEAQHQVTATSSDIYRSKKRYEEICDKLSRRQAALSNGRMSPEDRAQTVADTVQLAREQGEIKARLDRLEVELVLQQAELEKSRAEAW